MLLSYYPKQFRFDESYFKKTFRSSFWRLAIFSNSINISIEITNPILLRKYIEGKTFILDIKVLLNNNTIINLEMQIENQQNYPKRIRN